MYLEVTRSEDNENILVSRLSIVYVEENGDCEMVEYDDNRYSDNHISEFLLFYAIASNESLVFNKRNKLVAMRLKKILLTRYGEVAGNAIFSQILYNVDIEDFLKDYLRR